MKNKFIQKTQKPRTFTKRLKKTYNTSFFVNYSLNIILKKQTLFEFVYFKFLKTILKNSIKYKYFLFKDFFFFLTLIPNYPISLKGKNSRMGKGVGKFLSWIFSLKANFNLCSFAYIFKERIIFFVNILKKRINSNLCLTIIEK